MIFCKHDWEVVSDRTLPSPWEVYVGEGRSTKCPGGTSILFFEVVHLCIMYCRKCGEVKKITTSSIDK